MTSDGHWIFSAEGGAMAFVYVGPANPSNTTFPGTPPRIQMGAAEKRLQVGSLGVLAADLELDPGLDLTDEPETLPTGTAPEKYWPTDADYEDILYIAGGHLGLWAYEAHPIAGYTNHAVRVDNSGDLNVTTQDSDRFCTDVDVVQIGGQDYLLALFARRDDNLLRVYRLQDVRNALDQVRNGPVGASDLGHEILGDASIFFGAHSLQTPNVISSTGRDVTRSGSYAMDMAIDTSPQADAVGNPALGAPVDVYIAMLSGGLVRYRLYATGTPATITAFRTEGPIFGTGVVPPPVETAYDQFTQSIGQVQLNSSGLPAQWFKNHESRVAVRSTRHLELLRSDPPYFMDVALQNDDGGHYLYCAMGHLGWLRFDLGARAFRYGIVIDHLEGRPAVERDSNGVPVSLPGTLPGTVEIPGWKRTFPLDVSSSSPWLEPFDLGDPAEPNAMHAFHVGLTRVGLSGTNNERTVLVVTFAQSPWTMEPRIKGPGRVLDQTFGEIGAFDLGYVPLWRSETAAIVAVYDDLASLDLPFRYDAGQVISKDSNGVDLANHTRATRLGGESLWLPYEQPDNGLPSLERLRLLHTDKVLEPDPTSTLPNAVRTDRGNVCVSFIDLATGTNDPLAWYPAIVRDQTQMPGRYGFGAGFADIDDRVVIQANNDFPVDPAAPVVSLGLETGVGMLGQLAPPLPPQPPIVWSNPQDKRLDSGIQGDERCQFVRDTGGGVLEQWVIGDRTVPLGVGTYYYFGQHSYQVAGSGVPTIDLKGQWLLDRMQNQFGVDHHGYYRSMTAHPLLDDYTVPASANVTPAVDGLDPIGGAADTFVTASRIGSPDGVIVFGRDTMTSYLMGFTASDTARRIFREDPWVRDVAIRFGPPPQSLLRSSDWTFPLNSHPEWNNLHYPGRSSFPQGSTLALSQQLFWCDPMPALDVTDPDFTGRPYIGSVFPIKEMVSTYTFLPKVTELPLDPSGSPTALVLAAPCGYASCPPDLAQQLGTTLAGDPNDPWPPVHHNLVNWGIDAQYHFLPIPAQYNPSPPWDLQFRRGFVSLWQFSGDPAFPTPGPGGAALGVDPWSRARRATDPTPADTIWNLTERPAGSPDLDPLFLVGDDSLAFQLHFLKLTDDAQVARTFAVVADFLGTVQVFDVTDLLQARVGPRFPPSTHVWTALEDPLELRRPNIFDVATDQTNDPGRANVYVACSRTGVQVVAFDADLGFVGATQRIVTPGSAHSVTVRVSAQGTLLLVNDLMAGQRFYRKP